MHYYCTLFDSNYLSKGLALYESLCNVDDDFHLFVVAFDSSSYEILSNLRLEHISVVSLSDFETKELLQIKPTRNRAEYCWTAGPTVIYYFIHRYNLDHCTYVDADLMFFSSPSVLFDEIGDSSVAITEHIPNGPDMVAGKYCVQFVYFKNDKDGIAALKWWMNSCIDWCFAKYEDGKYGDQKYLESFLVLFNNVHVIKHRGAGVAAWNLHLYKFDKYGQIIYKEEVIDIIFFHFHGTNVIEKESRLLIRVFTTDLNSCLRRNIYKPYLELLSTAYEKYLEKIVISLEIHERGLFKRVAAFVKHFLKENSIVRYVYFNVFKVKYNGYQ